MSVTCLMVNKGLLKRETEKKQALSFIYTFICTTENGVKLKRQNGRRSASIWKIYVSDIVVDSEKVIAMTFGEASGQVQWVR